IALLRPQCNDGAVENPRNLHIALSWRLIGHRQARAPRIIRIGLPSLDEPIVLIIHIKPARRHETVRPAIELVATPTTVRNSENIRAPSVARGDDVPRLGA